MTAPATFPLNLIVDVSVNIAAQGATPPTFNQGLIVGTSPVIPSVGANSRVQQFASLTEMVSAGFETNQPEYLAAQLYFAPTPAPVIVNIGRQDLTAIQTAVPHAATGGTGYAVGDLVTVVQSGASLGQLTVLTVGEGGVVLTLGTTIGNQGTGYSVATGLTTTTTGSGTGLEVDITAIGETPLQAVTACRIASPNWYLCGVIGAVDADALAIAAFAESATPQMIFIYNTATAAVAAGTPGNVALALKAENFNRIVGQYATTQGGAFPSQAYFFAGFMGVAMGLNTGLANSYFTMWAKTLPGLVAEPVTLSQRTTIEGSNFNLYLSYANTYSFEEQGVVSNGQYFDEVLFLDMLASQLMFACVAAFADNNSIPQNNQGEAILINACNVVGQNFRSIGFIAQNGTWDGPTILNLEAGNAMPNGFQVQAAPFTNPKPANRAMMPIFFSLIENGSGQSLTIGVTVQR